MSEQIKEVAGNLNNFISLVEEHNDGSTPGFIDVSKMPQETQDTIHKAFGEMMQDVSDIFKGKER